MQPRPRGHAGSSPHTRGAPEREGGPPAQKRIIPAYAGSTVAVLEIVAGERDHPRIRGEHNTGIDRSVKMLGSSPHTRGALARRRPAGRSGRIIPAYAGSTFDVPSSGGRARDHPRIRGEHRVCRVDGCARYGSSPHTRGARRLRSPASRSCRIIPAYAGSTRPTSPPRYRRKDHPRIRGEHHHVEVPPQNRVRIIPAYAGSTHVTGMRLNLDGDHPRIRGEHRIMCIPILWTSGSSPHTRGAQDHVHPHPVDVGIIPAYAGSTRHAVL